MRRIRHLAVILAMACVMTVIMPGSAAEVFAAGARIAFSDPTASVGSKIKVNMKITSSGNLNKADVMLAYDANLLEFVSGTDAEGQAGAIRVHGNGGTPDTGTLAFALEFNAKAAGTSKITVTSQEITGSDQKVVNADPVGSSTVTVGALQTASKDATLKSLKVMPGSLTPEFSPDVDTYAVTVGTDVEKVIISAETNDANATNVISDNEGLQMGENRVTCKVVAQDGETTKEYVIVVTKAEGGASAEQTDEQAQVKMEISKRVITILPPDPDVKVPNGFKQSTINIDGHKVQGWVWGAETEHQYCVVYGMNEAGEKSFYRYDMKDNERTLQRYFEDPAISGSVSKEVFDELGETYDKLCNDYKLFQLFLIIAIAIAVVLLILLLVVVLMKKGKTREPGGEPGSGAGNSRARSAVKQTEVIENEEIEDDYEDGYEEDGEEDESEEDGYEEYEDDEEEIDEYEDYQEYDEEEYDGYPEEIVEPAPVKGNSSRSQTRYEDGGYADSTQRGRRTQDPGAGQTRSEQPSQARQPVRQAPSPASEQVRQPQQPGPVHRAQPSGTVPPPKQETDDDDFEIFDL